MQIYAKKHDSIIAIEEQIGLNIQHHSGKKGIIRGIKPISKHISIYLVEFADHNRSWFTTKEIAYQA